MRIENYVDLLEHALISALNDRRDNNLSEIFECVDTDQPSFKGTSFSAMTLRQSINRERMDDDVGSIRFGDSILPRRHNVST